MPPPDHDLRAFAAGLRSMDDALLGPASEVDERAERVAALEAVMRGEFCGLTVSGLLDLHRAAAASLHRHGCPFRLGHWVWDWKYEGRWLPLVFVRYRPLDEEGTDDDDDVRPDA